VDTDKNIIRKVQRLMVALFSLGPVLGAAASALYTWHLKSSGHWEPSTSLFHAMILFFALSITAPALGLTMRMMFMSLVLGLKGIENTERIGPAMEKFEKLLALADTAKNEEGEKARRVLSSIDRFVTSGGLERIEQGVERMAEFADPKVKDPVDSSAALKLLRKGTPEAKAFAGTVKGNGL